MLGNWSADERLRCLRIIRRWPEGVAGFVWRRSCHFQFTNSRYRKQAHKTIVGLRHYSDDQCSIIRLYQLAVWLEWYMDIRLLHLLACQRQNTRVSNEGQHQCVVVRTFTDADLKRLHSPNYRQINARMHLNPNVIVDNAQRTLLNLKFPKHVIIWHWPWRSRSTTQISIICPEFVNVSIGTT